MVWPQTDLVFLKPTCLKGFVMLDEITSEWSIFYYGWFQDDKEGMYCGIFYFMIFA